MTQPQLTVVIVGGGIGGLFAANALIAHGLCVSVYEQAPELGEVGAGVFLTPNSVRQLQRVGLGDQVERCGARVGHGSHYFRHDGAPIAPVQVTDSAGWNATFGMHRADLVEMLASALPPDVVRTGHRGVGFEQAGDVARVSFANGVVAEGDIVIAADGIHSELRHHAAPPSRPVFHGSVAYRGVLSHQRIPHWPTDRWQMWLGKGKHFLTFPVRSGELINYVGFVPADAEMKESWSAPGDPDVLRREFEGWDPRIGTLLSQVEKTFRWALYDREPLPAWTRGRLTLLGDAAHRCFRISARAPTSRSRMAWRWRQFWRRRRARAYRRCWRMSGCDGVSGWRRFSAVRARMACATTPPTPISAFATPRSQRMRRSANGFTIMTSYRKRRPLRLP